MYGPGLAGVAVGIIMNGPEPKYYELILDALSRDPSIKEARFIKLLKD